jgi:hypothetical protein
MTGDAETRRRFRLGRPRLRTVAIAVVAVLALVVAGLAVYVQPQPLLPEANASLASTPSVTFAEHAGHLDWFPADGAYTVGLVVYPGGKVPPAAYGPLAQAIAGHGYLVAIAPMPFNLAVLDIRAADEVIAAHPEVRTWALAGHSLGGSMAAQYLSGDPGRVRGLAFWAAYAASDLSGLDLSVVSTWGSLDAGAARMSGPEARQAVPDDAVFIEIPGGNHEQMGWYTGQPNDPPATISREDQQARVEAATVTMLEAIASAP